MKAFDHLRVTAEAVRQFVRMSQSPVAPMLLQHTSLIQDGSKDADISPIYTRATNWHFAPHNLERSTLQEPIWSFMEPLTFHISSDYILRKRSEEMLHEICKQSKRDVFKLLGRVLHHIQDMSTPSHVVPVYHGPLIADSFETYLNKIYLADDMNINTISANLQISPANLTPPADTTVVDIYMEAGQKTLQFLKSENSSFQTERNGVRCNLPWSYFWADKSTQHKNGYPTECTIGGFGSFGPLGKHFGTVGEIQSGDDTFIIENEVYEKFCTNLVRDMLVNSLRTLFLLEPDLRPLC
ncbi:hypothetical protein [Desulfosediminicola sp.]|uniref:hypothetical protein n=1 Tax=Desulfosediminicola sp. TaxID=2886825 RepID=UPI003AF2794E